MTKKTNKDAVILHLSTENLQDSKNQSYSSSVKRLSESFLKIAKVISENQNTTNSLTIINQSINKLAIGLSKQLNWQLSQTVETLHLLGNYFSNWYIYFPDYIRVAIDILSKHGWFYDLDMQSTLNIQEIILFYENEKSEEAEKMLINYFNHNIEKIKSQIIERFPDRAKIISAAFRAHENSTYELSVPVFLAQADGICFDLIKYSLFTKTKNKPETSIYVDSITTDAFRSALLFPLTEPLPISASKKERDENFSELNRHQVLHGEVVDYGTEINSLKSISLINYISQVLTMEKQ
jgi:hypothetical protein